MLKLGVQLHLASTLSKACHPQSIKEQVFAQKQCVYILFMSKEQLLIPKAEQWYKHNAAQFSPGSSGALATSWYSPPFERTERLHIRS